MEVDTSGADNAGFTVAVTVLDWVDEAPWLSLATAVIK